MIIVLKASLLSLELTPRNSGRRLPLFYSFQQSITTIYVPTYPIIRGILRVLAAFIGADLPLHGISVSCICLPDATTQAAIAALQRPAHVCIELEGLPTAM